MGARRRGNPTGGVDTWPRLSGHDDLFGANVLLVTGKGGVGKTTTVAALGLAAADSGRNTLLVEVEGRHSLSRALATAPWDYDEREFRPGLWGVALDPAESVYEYLELFYGLKRVQWMMERSNALDFVTTAAPGLRDLLLVGKVYEIEARRRDDGRRRFDTIIVDAPPTGRIVPFLQSPAAVTEIVRVGPIRRQAGQIEKMLTDPARTRAVLVSLLEDMPATEAVEGVAALADAGIRTGAVVANQAIPPVLDATATDLLQATAPADVAALVAEAGLEVDAPVAADLVTTMVDHRRGLARQRRVATTLRTAGTPVLVLPDVATAVMDVAALQVLADTLARQVGAEGPRGIDVAPVLADLAGADVEPDGGTDGRRKAGSNARSNARSNAGPDARSDAGEQGA